jgi:hypothetical protein
MLKRYKLLRNCFGYAAIISTTVFLTLLPMLLGAPIPHATSRFHADFLALLLIAMREMILLVPPVVALVNGMAWWALRNGAPSARRWAIFASVSCLVLSAPFLVADVAIAQYSLAGGVEFAGVLVLFLILSSFGIAGLAAFAKRDATLEAVLTSPCYDPRKAAGSPVYVA